jgi:cobyrinic acid a,c-diamide synthase
VEGNRGLFDGMDASGTHSTAELAKLIHAPVVLVIDATKSTRTVAALVLGCRALDPGLNLAGVILNRVGTLRQERLIREAMSLVCDVPVLGAIPRLHQEPLPSRHLGLVLPAEREDTERVLEELATAITTHVDLMSLRRVAAQAPELHAKPLELEEQNRSLNLTLIQDQDQDQNQNQNQNQNQSLNPSQRPTQNLNPTPTQTLRIGVLRDAAFCFYYPENLAALEAEGATVLPISPLTDRELPAIDALYAGGGYPEQFAHALAENVAFRSALAERIRRGLPVWAECGGLMYLSSAIVYQGRRCPMVGVFPFSVEHTDRPQGHGYVEARVDAPNPYLPEGMCLRGHEFHHSRIVEEPGKALQTTLALERGTGTGHGRDGVVIHRVFASYLHLFAPGNPDWAKAFVRVARQVHTEPSEVVT